MSALRTDPAYHLATQYFHFYVKERSIRVFRDMDEARAWLLDR